MAKKAAGANRSRRRAMAVGQGSAGGYAVPAAYDVGTSRPKTAPRPKRRRRSGNGNN